MPLEIAKLARELFQRNYDWKEPVRSVTVRAINLVSAKEPEQICLFSDPIRLEKEEKLFWRLRKFGGDLEKGLSIQRLDEGSEDAGIPRSWFDYAGSYEPVR